MARNCCFREGSEETPRIFGLGGVTAAASAGGGGGGGGGTRAESAEGGGGGGGGSGICGRLGD